MEGRAGGGEAGEIRVTMATTEEAPTVCQTMYMYHLTYSKQPGKLGTAIMHILELSKLRLREVKYLD